MVGAAEVGAPVGGPPVLGPEIDACLRFAAWRSQEEEVAFEQLTA